MLDPAFSATNRNEMGNPKIKKLRRYSVTFDAAEVATVVAAEQDVTVPGVAAGDVVIGFQPPAMGVAVLCGGARVKAANTIAVTFCNPTAGALNPTEGVYDFLVATYE